MNKPREYLKKLRTDKGMTLQEVALTFGISRQYYYMIETGECQKRMDITLVQKIADLFGMTIEQVVEEERKLGDAINTASETAPGSSEKQDEEESA